jgi:hypothetical protein
MSYWTHTSEASTIRGKDTSLLECIPLPSVTALEMRLLSATSTLLRYRCNSRLFGNDQLVEVGRSVLVVLLVPQNGGITLFYELLRYVAVN